MAWIESASLLIHSLRLLYVMAIKAIAPALSFSHSLFAVCNGYSDRQSRNRIILNLWLVQLSSEIAKSLTEVFLD